MQRLLHLSCFLVLKAQHFIHYKLGFYFCSFASHFSSGLIAAILEICYIPTKKKSDEERRVRLSGLSRLEICAHTTTISTEV